MFPLNWNIPFIRKNGSRTTLGAITGDIAGIEDDIAGIKEDVTPEYFDLSVRSSRVSIVAQKNCKIGKQIYLWCRFTPIASGSSLAAFTVPDSYRPSDVGTDSGVIIEMIAKNQTADSTKARYAQVISTGEVDVINVAQDGDYLIYGSYFID